MPKTSRQSQGRQNYSWYLVYVLIEWRKRYIAGFFLKTIFDDEVEYNKKNSLKMGGCISGTQEDKKKAALGKLISETTKDGSCVFDNEVLPRNSKKTLTNNGEFLFSKK